MKRNILIILAAMLVLFSSCSDMLDEKNYGNPTIEEMLKKRENVILLVGQAYADIKWLHDHWGYWGINTLTADECVCPTRMPGSHWADGGYWSGMNNHGWSPTSKAFENLWNKSISGAVLCNKTLKTLRDNEALLDPADFKQFVGELEVLRSYYYYTLFDCFGRIPYTEEFKQEDVPLLSAPEVWQKLVDCLERNAPNMVVVNDGNRAPNYGRVSQGFAYALLARLYLNAKSYGVTDDEIGNYTKCVAACDNVINSGSYSIEDNFFTNFKINNETSKENIFVIVEDGNATFDKQEDNSMMNKLRITCLTLHYSHQTTWDLIEKPWNGFCAPPEFINKYAPEDTRGAGNEGLGTNNTKQWGWFVGKIYDKDGTIALKDENGDPADIVNEITSLTAAKWNEGARLLKYEVDKEKKYQYCENDFVLFRYADVLYMKGEAIARGGAGTFDWTAGEVAKIRTRAGIAAYAGTPSLDEILDERGREFAWENVRRRDLIRYGVFANGSWAGWGAWRGVKSDAKLNWFPIPQAVIEKSSLDASGKHIWTQNPGY